MLVEVPVTEIEYQKLKDLSFDLCLTVRETVRHCLRDGLQENTEGTTAKIMKVLTDLHDLYYQNFLDGVQRHHEMVHTAIENGDDISSASESYSTATDWNTKSLALAEAIKQVYGVIAGGKDDE